MIKLVKEKWRTLSLSPFLDIGREDLTRICYILIGLGIVYIFVLLLLLSLSKKTPEILLIYLSVTFSSFLALLWFVRGGSYKTPFGERGELKSFFTLKTEEASFVSEDEELAKTEAKKVIKA